MFVIVEAAAYRHRIMGLAHDIDAAIELARQAAHTERSPHEGGPDGHHRYEIVELPVGVLVDDGTDRGYVAYTVAADTSGGYWRPVTVDLCYWSSTAKTKRHRPDHVLEPAPDRTGAG